MEDATLTYRAGRGGGCHFNIQGREGVEDATFTLLDTDFKHLDSTGNVVRILFMDFSSAFNTIQPYLLLQRLLDLQVNPPPWFFGSECFCATDHSVSV